MIRVGSIVSRVDDIERQTAFWTAALGYEARKGGDDDFVLLKPRDGVGPNVSLDRRPLDAPGRLGCTVRPGHAGSGRRRWRRLLGVRRPPRSTGDAPGRRRAACIPVDPDREPLRLAMPWTDGGQRSIGLPLHAFACGAVSFHVAADVAQLVEQRFCKPPVPGSSPVVGSN